ncbi:hypothetical protein ACFV2F_27295, partial [Streptomyces coelicoflavus]
MPDSAPPRALPALAGLALLLFALITWQVLADGPLVGGGGAVFRAGVPPPPVYQVEDAPGHEAGGGTREV